MAKADDLLERMRNTPNGWHPGDFRTLYLGFGFEEYEGGNHTTYKNIEFNKKTQVPRHRGLKPYLARNAVSLIDEIIELRQKKALEEAQQNEKAGDE